MADNIYYDGSKLLSYNKALSICLSSRGTGKSYYFKNLAVKNAIKSIEANRTPTGRIAPGKIDKFIILRRYKKEIALNNISRFLDDIKDNFPKYILSVKGRSIVIADKDKPKKTHEIGTFYALTEQTYLRSTVHNQVTMTIFDEAVLDTSTHFKYLRNEVNTYLEVISTIARNRNIRNIILGNAIKVTDFPYIDIFKFKIVPSNLFKYEFYLSNTNDQVILQMYKSKEEFKENLKNSNFGKLCSQIEGYSEYLIDGQELVAGNEAFILEKSLRPKDLRFLASFKIDKKDLGLWVSDKDALLYFSKKIDSSNKNKFAITDAERNLDYKGIKAFKNSYVCQMLRLYDYNNGIFYEDAFVQELSKNILSIIK